jgi:hypothetical protein
VGKVVQPLQSVNSHDSRAHDHEWCGPFTRLVGFDWVGSARFESSRSGSWYAAHAVTPCFFRPKLNAFLYVCQDQVSHIKQQIME